MYFCKNSHLLESLRFYLLLRQTLQNSVESIKAVSFKSNIPNSTAVTRSPTNIAMTLAAALLDEEEAI